MALRARAGDDRRSIRERILRACEDVLRESGPGALTVRRVTEVAGVSPASVNYSFGSKEAMIAAVLQRLLKPLTLERVRMLDEATCSDDVTVEAILTAFVRPVISLEPWHRSALALLLGIDEDGQGAYEDISSLLLGALSDRIEYALSRAKPDIPRRELRFRVKVLSGIVLMWALDLFSVGGAAALTERELIAFLAAGIEAPTPDGTWGAPSAA